ncbi:MAG: hypothetical protein H7Z19_00680 [Chitinophagaceae bacterium]|nr:hypothetical protein [Rubrivivax sp.]
MPACRGTPGIAREWLFRFGMAAHSHASPAHQCRRSAARHPRQTHSRGVKTIGAAAHYGTANLVAGRMIELDRRRADPGVLAAAVDHHNRVVFR